MAERVAKKKITHSHNTNNSPKIYLQVFEKIKNFIKDFNLLSLKFIKYASILSLSFFSILWGMDHVLVFISARDMARHSLETSQIGQKFLETMVYLSSERGVMARLFLGEQPATPADMALLTRYREASKQAFDAGLAKLDEDTKTKSLIDPEELKSLTGKMEEWEQQRQGIDDTLLKPLNERGMALIFRSGPVLTLIRRQIERIQDFRQTISRTTAQKDTQASQIELMINLTWLISEYITRERDELANVIATSTRISPGLSMQLASNRGRIDQAWQNLNSFPTPYPEIKTAIENVRATTMLGQYQKLRADVNQRGAEGKAYIYGSYVGVAFEEKPLTLEYWLNISDSAASPIFELNTILNEQLITILEKNYDNATTGVIVDTIYMLITICFSAFILFLIHKRLIVPLGSMTLAMNQLAAGNLMVEVPGSDRRDEIGAMARAVQVFKDGLVRVTQLSEQQQAEQARNEARAARVGSMVGDFDQAASGALNAIGAAATDLDTTARRMAGVAHQANAQAERALGASSQTSENIQTVAAAAEEMVASIREITSQVGRSRSVVAACVEEVDKTDRTVERMVTAAERIGTIVELIRSIAAQTNLLALNATIEAARAGDAGRGFAVVAGEVKTLAAQTAHATGDISEQIAAIQAVSRESVEAIRVITGTIQSLSEVTMAISVAMEQQEASTSEISRNVQEAATESRHVSESLTAMTNAVRETENASTHVLESAADLSYRLNTLTGDIHTFTTGVSAA